MRRIGLALGSGGWRGLAHLGVLRALEELEIRPVLYAGASVGALMAAAAAQGIRIDQLEREAAECRRHSLFRLDLKQLLRQGLRARALFSADPLRALCVRLFGDVTFAELPSPALVATVDIHSGETIWWGSPGRETVSVADAVYASCAMPGLLPPGRVGSHLCIDGGVANPLGLPYLPDLFDELVAVELDAASSMTRTVEQMSAAALWYRAQSLTMRSLSRQFLRNWYGSPVQVIRPLLCGAGLLQVAAPGQVIRAGYDATWAALQEQHESFSSSMSGG